MKCRARMHRTGWALDRQGQASRPMLMHSQRIELDALVDQAREQSGRYEELSPFRVIDRVGPGSNGFLDRAAWLVRAAMFLPMATSMSRYAVSSSRLPIGLTRPGM